MVAAIRPDGTLVDACRRAGCSAALCAADSVLLLARLGPSPTLNEQASRVEAVLERRLERCDERGKGLWCPLVSRLHVLRGLGSRP